MKKIKRVTGEIVEVEGDYILTGGEEDVFEEEKTEEEEQEEVAEKTSEAETDEENKDEPEE